MPTQVSISSPWISYVRKIEALFEPDPEIKIDFDNDDLNLKLYVEDAAKADALTQLLPAEKSFGNVNLKITVIPANANKESAISLFQKAFAGNPILNYIEGTEDTFSNPLYYFVFRNEVVQYFNDNLADIHGLESTLYQNLANEIFEGCHEGVLFCTDLPDDAEFAY